MPHELGSLRQGVPEPVKRAGRSAYVLSGLPTSLARLEPDFIVAGVQRGGTTSLFRALIQHPQIVRPTFHKGTNYFSVNYQRGPAWYRAHFPLRSVAAMRRRHIGRPVAFESSEYYAYHPLALARIASDLPRVKIVVILRDPVERAYSAYEHERARGYEAEDFDTALALEDQRLSGEVERLTRDPGYQSYAHRHYSYRHRGDYVTQLTRLYDLFSPERVLVLQSEKFFEQPELVFGKLMDFVGLTPKMPEHFDQHNARPRAPMSPAAYRLLTDFYSAQVDDMTRLLGERPEWDFVRSNEG
ncbi:MAG: sulfotransferase domain-containing protein [Nocardioidaceae bacterium]